MNTKLYWKLRTQVLKIVFSIRKFIFSLGCYCDDEKKNSSFFKQIMKTIGWKLLSTAFLVFPLYLIDTVLIKTLKATTLGDSLFVGIVVGGMGLAGVVLGLYCANISSIFSSSYNNVANELSNAYHRDIINKKCIGNTIGYIVFCVIVLGECIAKINVYYATILTFLFLTIKVIITFSVAGNRAYHLSTTYKLAENAYIDIGNTINKVTKDSSIGHDKNFQNHCRIICSRRIKLLHEISIYNKDNPKTQISALIDFVSGNNLILFDYWKKKHKIAFDSLWYLEIPEYQQWHEATYSETSLHEQTGSHLSVKKVKDYFWFEKYIESVNKKSIERLIEDKEFDSIYLYLDSLRVPKEVVYGDTLNYWVRFTNDLRDSILQIPQEKEDNPDLSAIIDVLTAIYFATITHICLYIRDINIENVLDNIAKTKSSKNIDLSKPYSHYSNNEVMKQLYIKINTETKNEGRAITPNWYIKQIASSIIYSHINDLCHHLYNLYSDILKIGDKLLDKKMYYEASLAFSRLLETDAKITALATESRIKEILHALKKYGKAPAEKWEKSNVDLFETARRDIRRTLPKKTLGCSQIFALKHMDDRKKHPDLLGYSYNRIYEYLVSSIEANDFETFEALYSNLLANVFLYREYIRNYVADKDAYNDNWKLNVVTSPIVDYAVVSALAIIWGEFIGDERWKTLVLAETKEYISKAKSIDVAQKDVIVQLFTGAAKWKSSVFSHCGRDITTTGWEQRVTRAIRSHDNFEIEYKEFGHKVAKNSSKFFGDYCGHHICDMGLNNTEELYWVFCVNPWCEPEDKYHTRSKWEENLDEE